MRAGAIARRVAISLLWDLAFLLAVLAASWGCYWVISTYPLGALCSVGVSIALWVVIERVGKVARKMAMEERWQQSLERREQFKHIYDGTYQMAREDGHEHPEARRRALEAVERASREQKP